MCITVIYFVAQIHLGLQGIIQVIGTAFSECSLIPAEGTEVQIPFLLWAREQCSSIRVLPGVMLH